MKPKYLTIEIDDIVTIYNNDFYYVDVIDKYVLKYDYQDEDDYMELYNHLHGISSKIIELYKLDEDG